jgi:hypothetical protein
LEREVSRRPRGDKNAGETAAERMKTRSERPDRPGREGAGRGAAKRRNGDPAVVSTSVRDTIVRFREQSDRSEKPGAPADDSAMNATAIDAPERPHTDIPLRFAGRAANSRASNMAVQSRKGAAYTRRFTERSQNHGAGFQVPAQSVAPEKPETSEKKRPYPEGKNRTRARFVVPPDTASAIGMPEMPETTETRIPLTHTAADAEANENPARSINTEEADNQELQRAENTLEQNDPSDTGTTRRRAVPADARPRKLRFGSSEPTSAAPPPRSSIRMKNAAKQGGNGSAAPQTDQGDTAAQSETLPASKPLSPATAALSSLTQSKNVPAASVPVGQSNTSSQSETPPAPQPVAIPSASAESKTPISDSAIPPATPTPERRDPDKSSNSGESRAKETNSSKLRFNQGETPTAEVPPGKKLTKARTKAERSALKLDQAEKRLPKKRSLQIQKTVDTDTGKIRRKLRFNHEVKSQRAHLKGAAVLRPLKAAASASIAYGHNKLYQVEHENVGVKAAHRGELLAEGILRSAYRLYKTAPYRKVEKLTRKTAKLNIKAAYQQALNDHPRLKSNIFSRMAQKRKIKKQYAKMAREARKTAKNVKNAGGILGKAAQSAVQIAARHPIMIAVAGGLGLFIALMSGMFASCANLGAGAGSVMTASSYLAANEDIDAAELVYTEFETDLRLEIADAESLWPGYNEYRYSIGDISHNPHELMAYLTARFQSFVYSDIEDEPWSLFAAQYQLTRAPSVEIRYADPTDANGDGDLEPYDWKVLTVTLTAHPFADIAADRLDDRQQQHYDTLTQTKGAKQLLANPLNMNWLPYVTSVYGWRVHPVAGGKNLHRGVDIGVPIGTEILAGQDGIVSTGYDAEGYGHYVVITGADGLVSKYAHLDSILVSNGQSVKTGDLIALSGNSGTSTGPHLHLELLIDGDYLNPIFFTASG